MKHNVFCILNPYLMLHLESAVSDHLNLEILVGILEPRNALILRPLEYIKVVLKYSGLTFSTPVCEISKPDTY